MKKVTLCLLAALFLIAPATLSASDEEVVNLLNNFASHEEGSGEPQVIQNYVVKRGDTLGDIAYEYMQGIGLPGWDTNGFVEALARANNMDVHDIIHPGDVIYIPPYPVSVKDDEVYDVWREQLDNPEVLAQIRAGDLHSPDTNILEFSMLLEAIETGATSIGDDFSKLIVSRDFRMATNLSKRLLLLRKHIQAALSAEEMSNENSELLLNLKHLESACLQVSKYLEYYNPSGENEMMVKAMRYFNTALCEVKPLISEAEVNVPTYSLWDTLFGD